MLLPRLANKIGEKIDCRLGLAALGLDSTWMGDLLGIPGATDKDQSGTPLQEHVSQADGLQTLAMRTGSGKVWTVIQTACR